MEFIHNEKILQHDNFDDGLGSKNIWERIKKLGEDKFYRVEYSKKPDGSEIEDGLAKRKEIKKYVEGDGAKLLINTCIADTAYILNVIQAYVYEDVNAVEQLYKEPVRSDAEQQQIDELIKKFGLTKEVREIENQKRIEKLLRENQKKQDNTSVIIPASIPKK